MKKTFSLKVSNHKPERQADSIKHEVKKYLARERKKTIPETYDTWKFDCRIGDDVQTAFNIQVSDINTNISRFVTDEKESFYLEILAKPGHKTKK